MFFQRWTLGGIAGIAVTSASSASSDRPIIGGNIPDGIHSGNC